MAIAHDALSFTTYANTTSPSVDHSASGSDRYVVVGVGVEDGIGTVTSISATYGGTSMTKLGELLDLQSAWSLALFGLADPPTGTQTAQVTHDGGSNADGLIMASSYTGVSSENNTATNSDTSGVPTVDITAATDDMVVDFAMMLNRAFNIDGACTGQTSRMEESDGVGSENLSSDKAISSDGTTTMCWDGSSGIGYGTIAVQLQPAVSDTTAPTLTNAAAAKDGTDGYSGSVDTDEGDGTLYHVVTQSATSPSASQVKAGQDDTGSAADASGDQAVSSTGTKNVGQTGVLSSGTQYWIHYMHEDAAANQSAVASSSSFTTDPASQTVSLTPAEATFEGVPTGVEVVAVSRQMAPAEGSWEGVPASPVPGALAAVLTAASGSWEAIAAAIELGAVNVGLDPALGSWAGVPITAELGAIARSLAAAEASWQAEPVALDLGAISAALVPAEGSWQAVAVSTQTGGQAVALTPAGGSWEAVATDTDLGAVTRALTSAEGSWAAVPAGVLPGPVQAALEAASGSWQTVALGTDLGPASIAIVPAEGSWQGRPMGIEAGAIQAALASATGSWEAVSAGVEPGELLVAAVGADGSWQGVPTNPDSALAVVGIVPAEGSWATVPVAIVAGPVSESLTAALGTWQAVAVDATNVEIGPVSAMPVLRPAYGASPRITPRYTADPDIRARYTSDPIVRPTP